MLTPKVTVNDVTELEETWARLDAEGKHVEMFLMEPVCVCYQICECMCACM
jgi:hypothetical protein